MSSVIQFLESLGGRPAPSAAEYASIVAGLEINDAQRWALRDRNHEALNALLDGSPKMLFLINTPSPNDHEAFPDDDKDGDGVPNEDEPPHERE